MLAQEGVFRTAGALEEIKGRQAWTPTVR